MVLDNRNYSSELVKKENVRKADEIAKSVRKHIDWFNHHSYDSPNCERELEKTLAEIREIESLLRKEGGIYTRDFFWLNRCGHEGPSLDTEVYEYATYIYHRNRKYDPALKYATKVLDDTDGPRFQEFLSLRERISRERYERSPEGIEAAYVKERAKRIDGQLGVGFTIVRVVLVVFSLLASVYAFGSRKGTFIGLMTFAFLVLFAITFTLYFYELKTNKYGYDPDPRAMVFAVFQYGVYSLAVYIWQHAYKTHTFLGFFGGQLLILGIAIAAGFLCGHIISKKV